LITEESTIGRCPQSSLQTHNIHIEGLGTLCWLPVSRSITHHARQHASGRPTVGAAAPGSAHQRASFKRPAARSRLAATHRRRGGCGGGRRAAVVVLLRRYAGAAGLRGRCRSRPTSGSTEPLTASAELCWLKEARRDLPAAETRVRKDRPRSARVTRRLRSGVCVSASDGSAPHG